MYVFSTVHCRGSIGLVIRKGVPERKHCVHLGDGRITNGLVRRLKSAIRKHHFTICSMSVEAHMRPQTQQPRYPSIQHSARLLAEAMAEHAHLPVYVSHIGVMDLLENVPVAVIDDDRCEKMVTRFVQLYSRHGPSPRSVLVHRPQHQPAIIPSLRYWRNSLRFETCIDERGNVRVFYSGHADCHEIEKIHVAICHTLS